MKTHDQEIAGLKLEIKALKRALKARAAQARIECPSCGGAGQHESRDVRTVTMDMAIDAGDRSMAGMPIDCGPVFEPCEECGLTHVQTLEAEHAALREALQPLLTSQVARRCGVSPDTVRFWERSGRLPASRTQNGVRLFDPATVERFASARQAARECHADDANEAA